MDTIERRGQSWEEDSLGRQGGGNTLADILERVLDKGIVVAGDIAINVIDIELLTIKLRLLIASVDKAKEIGIDWWESDPALSSKGRELQRSNGELEERVKRLEALLEQKTLPEGGAPRRGDRRRADGGSR